MHDIRCWKWENAAVATTNFSRRTGINIRIAVQEEAGRVCYIHGHLPVFQHEERDVQSFRMLTSQMMVSQFFRKAWILFLFCS
jgi:hypothetical protein